MCLPFCFSLFELLWKLKLCSKRKISVQFKSNFSGSFVVLKWRPTTGLCESRSVILAWNQMINFWNRLLIVNCSGWNADGWYNRELNCRSYCCSCVCSQPRSWFLCRGRRRWIFLSCGPIGGSSPQVFSLTPPLPSEHSNGRVEHTPDR